VPAKLFYALQKLRIAWRKPGALGGIEGHEQETTMKSALQYSP
jgi:hypothetical protein